MSENVRAMLPSDTTARWVVHGQRHVEGGGAAITLQVRDDGRVAVLAAGQGRALLLLDEAATGALAEAAAEAQALQREDADPVEDEPPVTTAGSGWDPRPPRAEPVPWAPAAPLRGRGPLRIGTRVVTVEPVHGLLCGFEIGRARLEGHPDVAPCAGCGLAVWVAPTTPVPA